MRDDRAIWTEIIRTLQADNTRKHVPNYCAQSLREDTVALQCLPPGHLMRDLSRRSHDHNERHKKLFVYRILMVITSRHKKLFVYRILMVITSRHKKLFVYRMLLVDY